MKNLRFFWAFLVLSCSFMDAHTKEPLPSGIYAASLTPLNPDLSCNCEQLKEHCLDLIERGCQGVVLFGTTGEGPSFSVEERKAVLARVISEGLDPKKTILANGSSGIPDTVDLARAALKQGCAAVLISPPSFFKGITEEGVIAFYRAIITEVANPDLRVLLYHIPQYSGVPITLNIIEALHREFPNIVIGLKESEGNIDFTKAIIDRFPGFQVFVGNEKQIIEAVYYGGAGSICGISNLYPELIVSLYEQGKQANVPNPPEIEAVFRALKGYVFISAAKSVMEMRKGPNWRQVRPPLVPLNEIQSSAFLSSLDGHVIFSEVKK